LWKKLILRKVALTLRKITGIDHKILSLRKRVLQFTSWELIFSIWVTDILKNELRILIMSSREFRSANETRDERLLVRCVYGSLSLTNGCVKRCALNLCDCNLPCDLAKWRRVRNTKLKNYCSQLDIRSTLPYLEGKFFILNCIYNVLNNDTINKHCKNIVKAWTSICMYVWL